MHTKFPQDYSNLPDQICFLRHAFIREEWSIFCLLE